jgi:hypothetical protein
MLIVFNVRMILNKIFHIVVVCLVNIVVYVIVILVSLVKQFFPDEDSEEIDAATVEDLCMQLLINYFSFFFSPAYFYSHCFKYYMQAIILVIIPHIFAS